MLVLAKTSYYLWESGTLVSASDVMPTDHWLNIWCIWHTYLETLQEFRSRHRIGWIMQDFREMCVSRSLLFCLETKMPWRQTPSRKKKAFVYNCDGECLSGSTKRCIFKSMWNIWHLQHRLFKIPLRVSHTGLLLWQHSHAPKRDAERNELWLVVWHVGQRPHAQALTNESCHLFQTFSRQSESLARRD